MVPGSSRKWLWVLMGLLAAGATALPVMMISFRNKKAAAAGESPAPVGSPSIGCMGRVEPEGGVIRVSAAYVAGGPPLIAELKVKEGDWVRAGQILAILESRRLLLTAVEGSEARVTLARSRLEQVKEGAKPDDIAALEAEIAKWEMTLENAQAEYKRYEKLSQTHDISSSELDEKRLAVETTKRTIEQTKHRLESLSKIRGTDIDAAEAEVQAATANLNQARAQLDLSVVRAPREGRILAVHAKPGEEVGPEGVLELGNTNRMVVIAEVYETDIHRVHFGQQADITGEAMPGKLNGVVQEVGSEVTKNSVLPTDPVAFSDARVVKVKILVLDAEALANLIYGKVNVVIHP